MNFLLITLFIFYFNFYPKFLLNILPKNLSKFCSIFCQNMVTAIKLFRSISCLIDSVISENWLVRYQVYSTSIIILKAISLRSLHFLHSFKLPQKIDKVISVLVQSPTCISAAIPNSGSNSNIDESMYHCQNH